MAGTGAGTNLPAKFVLLSRGDVRAELEIVLADNLAHVVAIRIRRIGIVNTIRNITGVLPDPPAVCASDQINAWQNAVPVPRKYIRYRETGERGALPIPYVV